jgi:hypothetical protein
VSVGCLKSQPAGVLAYIYRLDEACRSTQFALVCQNRDASCEAVCIAIVLAHHFSIQWILTRTRPYWRPASIGLPIRAFSIHFSKQLIDFSLKLRAVV